jgi:phosphoribosylanthranilate isomerase
MFKVKVCGVQRADQVAGIAALGVDALGLNFVPTSKRYLSSDNAKAVASAIPAGVQRVGVFVNAELHEILQRVHDCQLTAVQLHGDETPLFCMTVQDALSKLAQPVELIRALRLRQDIEQELGAVLDAIQQHEVQLAALLVDAFAPGEYGGTGHTADWSALGAWTARRGVPLVLAGGLNPTNVAQAVQIARADAVDTASGVEFAPGDKDLALVRAFAQSANSALSTYR